MGLSRRIKRRTFWCPAAEREVTVEFVEIGIPGFRRAVAVRSCSAYEDSSVVTCRVPYLNPLYRLDAPPPPAMASGRSGMIAGIREGKGR